MEKVLICLNGGQILKSRLKEIAQKVNSVIAVDGGANYLHSFKIIPDVLIGDMDSVKKETLDGARRQGVKIIEYPREKNETDSELAVQYALNNKVNEIIISGFFGDRFDHMVANINYLSKLLTKIKIKIIQNDEDIYFVNKSVVFRGKKEDEVSLIPLHDDAKGVVTKGLQYKLNNETLRLASTRGISNILNVSPVSVQLKKGVLMVVHRKL